MLAEQPTTLGEPYSRHLGGKVRELRCNLEGSAVRLTYWLASGRRIVFLTVFS
nr:type II toxin-antitoxin system RelE/ParE family toxin [Nonomuraea polychroma]